MDTTGKAEDITRSLRDMVTEVENLLRGDGDAVAEARDRLEQTLKRAKAKLGDWHEDLDADVEQALRVTQDYVTKHPWQSLSIAGFIGLLIGLLIARR